MSIFNIFARKDINEGVRSFRENKDAVLLDVRTREEYASGHIEGSRNLPLDEIDMVDSVIKDKTLRCTSIASAEDEAHARRRI